MPDVSHPDRTRDDPSGAGGGFGVAAGLHHRENETGRGDLSSGAAPGSVLVDDVWESFKVYHERAQGLRDRLFARRKNVTEEFWALRGVSLRLDPGDTVGLIGENGSGKSTLLKCIAGILRPSRGTVQTYGRTASMLELGAGFHPDLTGRENVYLNSSILGFSRRYTDQVFDEMVEFAGQQVAEAIDRPVRTYSSGMYLRLGFAVSVHLQPDILIIDEVLAVGDAKFVKKCYDRIHELKRRGVTIVVVSHDLETVATLCDRAIYLERGKVVADGPSVEVVDRYRADVTAEQGGAVGRWEGGAVYGSGDMTLRDIRLLTGGERDSIRTGDRIAVKFRAHVNAEVDNPVFGLIVRANDGTYLYDTNTLWRHQETGRYAPGDEVEVTFELRANLLPGRYTVTVAASRHDGKVVYDWHSDALGFDVAGEFVANGLVELDGSISVMPIAGT
ncbi:MAG: ABC transporter ATP-binding protein [Acidimicrobiales bacterium]|nr:ABC transporter ATP-binding protein [Acidimicrobiales bacterium]